MVDPGLVLGWIAVVLVVGGLLTLWTFLMGRDVLVAVVGPVVAKAVVAKAVVAALAAAAARIGESLEIVGLWPWP